MDKSRLILLVVMLPITLSFAQSKEEEIEAYDNLQEWAVVKLTLAYMEDLKNWPPANLEQGSNDELDTYKLLSEKYSTYAHHIDLDIVGSLLSSGGWKKTKIEVFDNYKVSIIDSMNTNFYCNITSYGYNEKNSEKKFEEAALEILLKFQELLARLDEQETSNTKSIENTQKVNLSKTDNGNNNSFLYLILGALFISNLLFIRNNIKLSKKKNDLKRRISKKKTEDDNLFNQINNSRNDNSSSRILEEELEGLRKENLLLRNEFDKFKLMNLPQHEAPGLEENGIDDSQPTSSIIYFPSPFEDSKFANEDASSDKNTRALYKVDYNEQLQTGCLTLIADADMSKALNSPNSYLEPACIFDNEFTNSARGVKVMEEGEVKSEGVDWIVTRKLRIKFI